MPRLYQLSPYTLTRVGVTLSFGPPTVVQCELRFKFKATAETAAPLILYYGLDSPEPVDVASPPDTKFQFKSKTTHEDYTLTFTNLPTEGEICISNNLRPEMNRIKAGLFSEHDFYVLDCHEGLHNLTYFLPPTQNVSADLTLKSADFLTIHETSAADEKASNKKMHPMWIPAFETFRLRLAVKNTPLDQSDPIFNLKQPQALRI